MGLFEIEARKTLPRITNKHPPPFFVFVYPARKLYV